MEVILLEKIRNLGNTGEIVNVKDGYGRNFLLKTGKALRADKKILNLLKEKKMKLIRKMWNKKNMRRKFLKK